MVETIAAQDGVIAHLSSTHSIGTGLVADVDVRLPDVAAGARLDRCDRRPRGDRTGSNREASATDHGPGWRQRPVVCHDRRRCPDPACRPPSRHRSIRRVAWHIRRVGGQLDRRFFLTLAEGIVGFVLVAAVLITLVEKPWTLESVFDSFNWGIATVLGQGDSAFVTSPAGRIVGWLLILFGVAMLGMITGALVAMVIDFLLKEGQGLGASGYKDHIVVCGWNTTARDLIDELRGDDYKPKVVVIADLEKNPAGDGVYFVRGDATNAEDLERAGIKEASAALVFPADASDEADMQLDPDDHGDRVGGAAASGPSPRSTTRATSRTSVRADVDELLVTSKIASHLLARSALYPGLTGHRHRHRVGRRGLRALPDHPARRVHRPVDRRGRGPAPRRPSGDAAVRSIAAATPS